MRSGTCPTCQTLTRSVDEDLVQAGAANLGLRDVILALEWVKTNIWAFGGDANRVS